MVISPRLYGDTPRTCTAAFSFLKFTHLSYKLESKQSIKSIMYKRRFIPYKKGLLSSIMLLFYYNFQTFTFCMLLDSSRWPALIYLPVWYAYMCSFVSMFSCLVSIYYGVNWSLFCMLQKCQHHHTCILLTTPFSPYAPFSRETLRNQVLTF